MLAVMENPYSAPPIETATDPVQSTADLRQRWLALISPLGFGGCTLWLAFLGPDRCMRKVLTPIAADPTPDRRFVFDVVLYLQSVLDGYGPGTTGAFLLSRPGSGPISEGDRQWAALLAAAAAGNSTPVEPFFRAHNESLVQVQSAG